MGERLKGKISVVFGAGQTPGGNLGNGRASAILYAREGASVVCADLDLTSAEETRDMIVREGGKAIAFRADVTREADCKAAIDACLATFARIDILHNNVGGAPGDSRDIAQIEDSSIDRVTALNLKSVIFACKHALPPMRLQRSGSIINISSVSAVCSAEPVLYKATKLAINGVTQQMALANAEFGVRVNAIMPGLMDTPMAIEGSAKHYNLSVEQVRTDRNAKVALRGKMGTAWDVAYAALFLASDEAGFITGVMLPVDGGQTARVGW